MYVTHSMIRLEEKYEEAIQFRKRGFTYSEIAKIVGVSKSTVSNWLSKKAFSKKVRVDNTLRAARDNVKRIGLVNKARNAERKALYRETVSSAETEYKHYKKDPLFTAGLMAYVCNGDMRDPSRIRLSSTDPLVHKAFLHLVYEFTGTEKGAVHFWLLLQQKQDEKKSMLFWSKQLKLSIAQFYKTQLVSSVSGNQGLHHGTGNTIIGNTVLKKKLIRWIELFSKEL